MRYLYQQMPQPIGCEPVNYKQWNHIDFLYAKEVNKYFNDGLVQFIKNATDSPNFIQQHIAEELAKRGMQRAATKPETSILPDFKVSGRPPIPEIMRIALEPQSLNYVYGNEIVWRLGNRVCTDLNTRMAKFED